MTDTLSMRLLNVDIILNSYEGLLVYEKALIDPDYGENRRVNACHGEFRKLQESEDFRRKAGAWS